MKSSDCSLSEVLQCLLDPKEERQRPTAKCRSCGGSWSSWGGRQRSSCGRQRSSIGWGPGCYSGCCCCGRRGRCSSCCRCCCRGRSSRSSGSCRGCSCGRSSSCCRRCSCGWCCCSGCSNGQCVGDSGCRSASARGDTVCAHGVRAISSRRCNRGGVLAVGQRDEGVAGHPIELQATEQMSDRNLHKPQNEIQILKGAHRDAVCAHEERAIGSRSCNFGGVLAVCQCGKGNAGLLKIQCLHQCCMVHTV